MTAWIPGNALIALTAAASWGGGDFSGGMAVKSAGGSTRSALRVLIVAHAVSLAALLIILTVWHGARPDGTLLAWGLGAGVAAGGSLAAFYIALSRGAMGAAAAVSGLLAAAIPALVSWTLEGAPTALRLAGFALAAGAIWTIAAAPPPQNESLGGQDAGSKERKTMALAVLGGLGFGFYFVALRMDNGLGVFEPLALARAGSITTCAILLMVIRFSSGNTGRLEDSSESGLQQSDKRTGNGKSWCLSRSAVRWALGVALLDTGGNLLFLAATRLGRLDVAAVLASLYPASTILLAAWRLHERPTRRQIVGMSVALLAVVMITL